jgi:hypothetical protein
MFCPSEAPLNPRLRPRPYLTTSTNPAQRVRAPATLVLCCIHSGIIPGLLCHQGPFKSLFVPVGA